MSALKIADKLEAEKLSSALCDEAADLLRKQHHMISWRDTRLLTAKASLAFRDVKIRELTDEVDALEDRVQEAAEANRALASKVTGMLETIDRLHQRTVLQEREIEAFNRDFKERSSPPEKPDLLTVAQTLSCPPCNGRCNQGRTCPAREAA